MYPTFLVTFITYLSFSDSPTNNAVEAEFLFPPPLHAGLFLRKKSNNFQLPHDIWSSYTRNQISSTQNASKDYVKIEKSKFFLFSNYRNVLHNKNCSILTLCCICYYNVIVSFLPFLAKITTRSCPAEGGRGWWGCADKRDDASDAFCCKKLWIFCNLWRVCTDGGGGIEPVQTLCGQRGSIYRDFVCADVFYGRPPSCLLYCPLVLVLMLVFHIMEKLQFVIPTLIHITV